MKPPATEESPKESRLHRRVPQRKVSGPVKAGHANAAMNVPSPKPEIESIKESSAVERNFAINSKDELGDYAYFALLVHLKRSSMDESAIRENIRSMIKGSTFKTKIRMNTNMRLIQRYCGDCVRLVVQVQSVRKKER